MIVAGIGCRRGAAPGEIEEIVRTAAAAHGIAVGDLGRLATEASKAVEPGVVAAARALALPLVSCSTAELEKVLSGVVTRSERVAAAKGVPSIAEAAALAAAGREARLFGPRVSNGRATCAIAEGEAR